MGASNTQNQTQDLNNFQGAGMSAKELGTEAEGSDAFSKGGGGGGESSPSTAPQPTPEQSTSKEEEKGAGEKTGEKVGKKAGEEAAVAGAGAAVGVDPATAKQLDKATGGVVSKVGGEVGEKVGGAMGKMADGGGGDLQKGVDKALDSAKTALSKMGDADITGPIGGGAQAKEGSASNVMAQRTPVAEPAEGCEAKFGDSNNASNDPEGPSSDKAPDMDMDQASQLAM
jgi:hypothetical protein